MEEFADYTSFTDKSSQVKAWTPCGGPILGAGGEPKETIFTNPYLQIASL